MNDSTVAKTIRQRKAFKIRLRDACKAVPTLEKLGKNPKYNYVRASQIFEAFRAELMKRDILLLPNEVEVTGTPMPTAVGTMLRLVTLKVEYELVDCLSEESVTKTAFGEGIDHGDKAIYKAKTGALKYFFRVLGIIPWLETDDPEFDESVDELTDPENFDQSAYDKKTKQQTRISDKQARAFDAASHRAGKTAEQVAAYLKSRFGALTVTDLLRLDYNEALKWASGTEEIAKTIEASIQAINSRKPAPQPVVELMDSQPEELPGA